MHNLFLFIFILFNFFCPVFASIQSIQFFDQQSFDSSILLKLEDAEQIEGLYMERLGENKVDFALLQEFTNLKALCFRKYGLDFLSVIGAYPSWLNTFTREELATFPSLPLLEKIILPEAVNSQNWSDTIEWLTQFKNLKYINFSQIGNIYDAPLRRLIDLENLEELDLSATLYMTKESQIEKLSWLREAKNLTKIKFDSNYKKRFNTEIDDPEIKFLLTLDHLEDLSINNFSWYSSPINYLNEKEYFTVELLNLKKLNIYAVPFLSLNFNDFVPNLENLILSVYEHIDLRELGHFKNLKSLTLSCKIFSQDSIWELENMEPLENLTSLHLDSDASKINFVKFAPNLEVLNLGCDQFSASKTNSNVMSKIKSLTKLKYLNLNNTKVKGSVIKNLSKFKDLHTLLLAGLDLTHANFEGASALEILDLKKTILPLDVFNSLKNLTHLKKLNLFGITSKYVTSEEVEKLRALLPNCEICFETYIPNFI